MNACLISQHNYHIKVNNKMPINGRYYQRPLFARDHINQQHAMDAIHGRNEKYCAREMTTYFNCAR